MKEALCNALEGANKRNREYREQIERLQKQLDEANRIIEGLRPFIQGSNDRQTFMKILHYEEKWGVK